jgi:hypothetical protein
VITGGDWLVADCAPDLAVNEDPARRPRPNLFPHLAEFANKSLAAGFGALPPLPYNEKPDAQDYCAERECGAHNYR